MGYHDGESERRLGKALKNGHRAKAFGNDESRRTDQERGGSELPQSLQRLKMDYIDLLQHHEVIRFDDVDRIFAKGGANEAFLAAQRAGKIRYIGFTGHKDPQVHLYMLATAKRHGCRFDTVQMPLNLFDTHYRSFEQMVLPELVADGIGVLGMKSMGGGVILKSKTVTPMQCLHYAMTLPTSVVITGIDSMKILKQALEAVTTFQPLSKKEIARLRASSVEAAGNGEFELFKTTSIFDATARNPEWLGEESSRTRKLTGD